MPRSLPSWTPATWTVDWEPIVPNSAGDWINPRNADFETYTPLAVRGGLQTAVFSSWSAGLKTTRDAWVYNFSAEELKVNVQRMIAFYGDQLATFNTHCAANDVLDRKAAARAFVDRDSRKVSWDEGMEAELARGVVIAYDPQSVRVGTYRPFTKQRVYFNRQLNSRPYQLPRIFPGGEPNVGFYVTGVGSDKPFSVLMTEAMPDLALWGSSNGQYFPRYTYAERDGPADLFSEHDGGPVRSDNISPAILTEYRSSYGSAVTADDVFFFTYGLLHSPDYRSRFAADLKKMLPRIPKVSPADFAAFAAARRELSDLHVGYETVEPYPLDEVMAPGAGSFPKDRFKVTKMTWGPGSDRSRIVVNPYLTLAGIPDEAHRYLLGSRTALDWLLDRYRVTVHADSGIRNDPNDWSDDPSYIVDLVRRIVTVSVETMRIVWALPPLRVVDGSPAE